MLKEVLPGLFVDQFRSEFFGVQTLNYSFIPGKNGGRSLLVDAGLPETVDPTSRNTLLKDLRELNLDPEKLDCIITHTHRDHVGQAHLLNELGASVYLNPADMAVSEEQINHEILHPQLRKELFRYIGLDLSPDETYRQFWKAADAFTAGFENAWKFQWKPLPPGSRVSYGDYHLETVPLPGHTVGHMGLWDEEKKVLFSGDVLVHGITPIVSDSGNYPNALDDYLNSLRAVKHQYADCLFVPGHGAAFRHPEEEVDSAVQNYLDKCSIMYDVLRHTEGPLTIRGVALRAYGRYGKHLTDEQRRSCILIWFKTSACLQYMQERNLVKETVEDGISLWTAVRPSGT